MAISISGRASSITARICSRSTRKGTPCSTRASSS
jgi:hypothetical protein